MAKFEKFDSRKRIAGLAEAALQIQAEELIRAGKMPSRTHKGQTFDTCSVVSSEVFLT